MFSFNLAERPSRKKAVVWYTVGGWVSNCVIILQGFLLIPLYIHYLGAGLYGYWLASGGLLAWLAMVDVGGTAITRQRCAHAYGQNNLLKMVNYFWHGAIIIGAVIALFLLLLFTLSPFIPGLIRAEENYHSLLINCLILSGIGTGLNIAQMFFREFAAAAQRTEVTTLATILGLITSLVITIVGLVALGWGLYALAIGALVRAIIPLLINAALSVYLLRSGPNHSSWSRAIFRDYLVTTPAVLAAKTSGVFSAQLPVILLTRWAGPEVTVAYTVSLRLLEMAKHFINHPLAALYAATAHYFGDTSVTRERKRLLFSKIKTVFSATTLAAFSYYVLVNKGFISLWISTDKYVGQVFVVLAATAILLQLRNNIYTSFIGAHGAIQISGYTAAAERIITAAFQVFLIYQFGAEGAMLAIILGSVLFQIPYHYILSKLQPEAAESLKSLQWFWMVTAMIFLGAAFISDWWVVDNWVSFLVRCSIIAPIPVAIIILGIPEIKTRVLAIIQKTNLYANTHR
jgi:O-antigen/teichoic acid export membrane protein